MFAVRVYLIQTERKGDARAASHEMFEALSKHRCSIHYGEGAYFRQMRSVFMDAFDVRIYASCLMPYALLALHQQSCMLKAPKKPSSRARSAELMAVF